jgi:adenylosuccinate synthase
MAGRKIILLITGEICSGKTTLSDILKDKFGFLQCKTKNGIKEHPKAIKQGINDNRILLQKFGEELDKKNNGKWVLEYFQKLFSKSFQENNFYVIDSIRIFEQIKHFRSAYSYITYHIHLTASSEILEKRYIKREKDKNKGASEDIIKKEYKMAKANVTESHVKDLAQDADLVINTERCNVYDVFIRVASFLKLLPPTQSESVDVIIGGQFGSEGKGQIAAYLSPEYDCLLRVGGPNAGHSVYESPKHDVFHLLPSGTKRNSGAKLILGPGAVLNLSKLLEEIKTFGVEDADRLIIDENATIISEEDIKYEEKLKDKISSTAQGVGKATSNNILNRLDGKDNHKAKNYDKYLKKYLGSAQEELEKLFLDNKKILLEGTQGSLLSLHHGFYPNVTSRDTTVSGCLSEAGISPRRVRRIIMVTRTYPIRVGGNSGDFYSTEISLEDIANRSGKNIDELRKIETTTTTKRNRRIAEFSWSLFRKSCELNSPTDIALTFVDYFSKNNERASRYDLLTSETRQMIEEVERCSGVKVSLIGTCFDYRAIIDRRNWR